MSELNRLRWRCRRGLLELDLTLQRFVASELETLSPAERLVLAELLDYPDNDLWDVLSGRRLCEDSRLVSLVERIRAQ
jgi:succinate dehydrogenase flavin-adding protein (antitoxin of CptAB toxin-antitoxin module)